MRYKYAVIIIIVLGVGIWAGRVTAQVGGQGTLDSPGLPANTQSYTLSDLYNRLNSGAAGTQSSFTEPTSGPTAGTGHSLNELMAKAPALDNSKGATSTQVLAGRIFWGLAASQWATQTGTMANNGAGSMIVPTTTNQSVAAGYWSSANAIAGDADLVASKIASGTTLFGIDGSLLSAYNSGVPKTGETATFASGDDGDLEKGAAWPNPRFTDNGMGRSRTT